MCATRRSFATRPPANWGYEGPQANSRKGTRDLTNETEHSEARAELEALLFAAGRALAPEFLARRIYIEEAQVLILLRELAEDLQKPGRGLQLREAAGKWRLETRLEYADVVASLRVERGERPLSRQAIEALAVVALGQPVTTEEVTATRGVESHGAIETLSRRGLIAPVEQRQAGGRAARWQTTGRFLEQFGLGSLEELYREDRLEKVFGTAYSG